MSVLLLMLLGVVDNDAVTAFVGNVIIIYILEQYIFCLQVSHTRSLCQCLKELVTSA